MQVKYSFLYTDLPKVAVYLSLKGTEFGTDIILTSLKKIQKKSDTRKALKTKKLPLCKKELHLQWNLYL